MYDRVFFEVWYKNYQSKYILMTSGSLLRRFYQNSLVSMQVRVSYFLGLEFNLCLIESMCEITKISLVLVYYR